MKKIMPTLITLILTGMVAAVSTSAQTTSLLVADIPFDFSVRDKVMPAGRYTIKELSSQAEKTMEITSKDGKLSALFPVEHVDVEETLRRGELIFHRAGGQNFLVEVLDPWDDIGATVVKSRAERLLEKGVANMESRAITVPTLNLAAHK